MLFNSKGFPVAFNELSSYMQTKICMCAPSIYGPYPKEEWYKGWIARCSVCKKHRHHRVHQCVSCSDIFIKDFRHPAWNWRNTKCWRCLEREDPDLVYNEHPAQADPCKIPGSVKTEHQMLELAAGPSVFSFKRNA